MVKSSPAGNGTGPAESGPRLLGGRLGQILACLWAGLVLAVFLYRYLGLLDRSYGLTAKLQSEGLLGVLARWLGIR